MSNPAPDFEDDWAQFEPSPPPQNRFWFWLIGFGLVGVLLAVACGLVLLVYFLPRDEGPATAPALSVPTPVSTAGTPTSLPIAPTITRLPAETVPLPDQGNVSAARAATPPRIDGVLDDWPAAAGVTSAYRVYNVAGWDGSADCTAVWQLSWDNTQLYVAVAVTDDIHVQTAAGNQIFRGDSVDIQFDTARAADFGDGLSPDDFQITLSPGDFAARSPTAFRFRGTPSGAILDAPGGHQVTLAAQRTADGYTLEAAIPWSDLALTPQPGLMLGIALNANDNDTPETAVQEVMMSHVPARTLTDPTSWGTLTLE